MSLYQKEIYNVDKIISDFIENNPDIELNTSKIFFIGTIAAK